MLEELKNLARRMVDAALAPEDDPGAAAARASHIARDRDVLLAELRVKTRKYLRVKAELEEARTQLETNRIIFESVGLPADCTVSDVKSLVESQSWKAALEYAAAVFDSMGGSWQPGDIGRKLRSLAEEGPKSSFIAPATPAPEEADEVEKLKSELADAQARANGDAQRAAAYQRERDEALKEAEACHVRMRTTRSGMKTFENRLLETQLKVNELITRLKTWDENTRQVFASIGAPYGEDGVTIDEMKKWFEGVTSAAEARGHQQNQDRWMGSIAERWPGLPKNLGVLQAIEHVVTQHALVAAKKELFDEDSWPDCFHEVPRDELFGGLQVIGDNILSLEEALTR